MRKADDAAFADLMERIRRPPAASVALIVKACEDMIVAYARHDVEPPPALLDVLDRYRGTPAGTVQ